MSPENRVDLPGGGGTFPERTFFYPPLEDKLLVAVENDKQKVIYGWP